MKQELRQFLADGGTVVEYGRRLVQRQEEEIAHYNRDNPSADYSIETLAKRHGVSIATFSKCFKQAKGLPLHAFLLDCRIDNAKRQLRQTARSVAAIGHGLGFCSTQHFARTFKHIVGISPNQYRIQVNMKYAGERRDEDDSDVDVDERSGRRCGTAAEAGAVCA